MPNAPKVFRPVHLVAVAASRAPAPPLPAGFITCACGLAYSPDVWKARPVVGRWPDGVGGELELRNCSCGSTRATEVPPLAKCSSDPPPPPPAAAAALEVAS